MADTDSTTTPQTRLDDRFDRALLRMADRLLREPPPPDRVYSTDSGDLFYLYRNTNKKGGGR